MRLCSAESGGRKKEEKFKMQCESGTLYVSGCTFLNDQLKFVVINIMSE